jgi:hypothetical protein
LKNLTNIETKLARMERAIPRPPDRSSTPENSNRLAPQFLLAAAAMLVTVKGITPEQAQHDLEILDQACQELFGPRYSSWPEFWEYRSILESFAEGRGG